MGVFEHAGPERLVSGGMWFLILMLLSGVFWWSASIFISRFYGPTGYGIFNTATSMHNFAWVIVFGGISQGLMKYGSEYVAKSGWKLTGFFSTALKYLTTIGIVMFILLSVIAFKISDPIMRSIVLIIAVSFLFSGTKDALAAIIGSFQKSDQLSIINSSRALIVCFLLILFMFFGVPSYALPSLIVAETAWQLGLSIYFLRHHITQLIPFNIREIFKGVQKVRRLENLQQFTKIFAFGMFISLGMISFNVMKSLDIIVLKMFFDYADVGVYSVADTASSILFYMTSFSLPVIPAIAEAYAKKDKRLLEDYVGIAIKYPVIIGVPITVIILTMARPLIVGIYGFPFEDAVFPLQILITGTFMLMFGYNLSSILIGMGKSKLSGILMGAAAAQYIIALFMFIPLFGFPGAALSLTLTGFSSMLLVPYYLKKELKISIYSGLWKVVLSAATMAAILFVIPKTDIFVIVASMVGSFALFIVLLYLFGYMTSDDFYMLRIAGGTFKDAIRKRKR